MPVPRRSRAVLDHAQAMRAVPGVVQALFGYAGEEPVSVA